jgi:hypothetical protein
VRPPHYDAGLHYYNEATLPATPEQWTDPVLIMGGYDGQVAFFEPMVPLSFLTGQANDGVFFGPRAVTYEAGTR